MVRPVGPRAAALVCAVLVLLAGACAPTLSITPPPLEVVRVELVPFGAGADHVCRLSVVVRNPSLNDRLVARGEIVLVENRLGVTMTEIIKAA